MFSFSACQQRDFYAYNDPMYSKEVEQARKEIKDSTGVNLDLSELSVMPREVPGVLAQCMDVSSEKTGHKIITVSPSKFKKLPDSAKVTIILHELGHCYFGLQHVVEPQESQTADLMVFRFSFYMLYNLFSTPEGRAPYIIEMVKRGR